jgi:hypothetical protein
MIEKKDLIHTTENSREEKKLYHKHSVVKEMERK